jgi:phenylacetate-CoA ligase
LKQVVGRQLDVLSTPSGQKIPGEFFPHFFKDIPSVNRFQVVQNRPDRLVIRIVSDAIHRDVDFQTIRERLHAQFHHTIRIDLEHTDSIALSRSGKLQVVVNQCQS